MKIIYIAMKYDYGKPERGFSFEHYNFYDSLKKMEEGKHEIIYFPFDEIMLKKGREEMNNELLNVVEKERPNLCFFFLFEDEINKETIKKISERDDTTTFNWFADDHWRFETFSKHWAPVFNFVSTTDSKALEKYKKIGYKNILKSQWAYNNFLYGEKEVENKFNYQVSFVGQAHGNRKKIIDKLIKNGIKVETFGSDWENGRVDQEKMIEIFKTSKINLNFTKSSGAFNLKTVLKIFLKKENGNFSIDNPLNWLSNFKSFLGRFRKQIKGRIFEIAGCGGFLITEFADNLEEYYDLKKEIVCFSSVDELTEKINYFLQNEKELLEIKKNGFERTIKEHTYEKRFIELFKQMNLYE